MRIKNRVLSMILAVAMAVALLPAIALPAFAAPVYHPDDVAAINAIITNNGLSGYDLDDPDNWDFATWNSDATSRIFFLYLSEKSLSGSLDISGLSALTHLYTDDNQLTSLDVSGLTSLTEISAENNQLASIDVSGATALTTLYVNNNQLTSLDVSSATALMLLAASYNQLSSLDASGLSALEVLGVSGNQLTSLDVSGLSALTYLYVDNNQLSSLDVSGLSALIWLDVYGNHLTSLDVSSATALEWLYAYNNQLTSLDVSGATALTYLNVSDNRLPSLDVSGLSALTSLDVSDNQLTSLDISGATALEVLGVSGNQLTSLDVSGLSALETLSVSGNQLTSLDVSGLSALTELYCDPSLEGHVVGLPAGLVPDFSGTLDTPDSPTSPYNDDSNSGETYFPNSSGAVITAPPEQAALRTSLQNGRFRADNIIGGAVSVRVSVPEGTEGGLNFAASLISARANAVRNIFAKWFDNEIAVISFEQADDWGQAAEIAAKIDLSGFDTSNLVFYSYNRATNTYRRIAAPSYRIDANGYLHFTTELAGDIIISNGALAKK